MQQLTVNEKIDSKKEVSCLKWTIFNGRRNICVNSKTDTNNLKNVVYRYRNKRKDLKLIKY